MKNPIVISASRKTDIAFHPDLLVNGIAERERKGMDIHSVVIWSKHPEKLVEEPFVSIISEYHAKGYGMFFHLSITGFGGRQFGMEASGKPLCIEPGVITWEDSVSLLPYLINMVGDPRRIRVRIDPLLKFIDAEGCQFSNYDLLPIITEECASAGITDFSCKHVDVYAKVSKRFEKVGATLIEATQPERLKIWKKCRELEFQRGIHFSSCADGVLGGFACIDGARLTELHPTNRKASLNDKSTRNGCSCTDSIDIGWYYGCPSGCLYCYGAPNRT